MKQPEDNKTADLFGKPTTQPTYRFYTTTREGATTEWKGLTRKQARDMNAYTDQSNPSNIIRFGWGEVQ